MKHIIALVALSVACIALWAERPGDRPAFEVKSVFPKETAPAVYEQVDPKELQFLADQGWEMVGVVPYVYKNEERGTPAMAPRPMVTVTYPAYFFKRLKGPNPRQ